MKDSKSPKLQDNTHTQRHTDHRKPLSSRWLGAAYSCKGQMAWNIKRNEQSAETARGRVGGEEERGQRNISSMLQPGLLEKRQKNRDRERDRGLRCSADRLAFKKQRGLSEGQQELGSTVR